MVESCSRSPQIFNICEFIGSMFLVIAAIAPMILFIDVFKADIAVAVVADALAVGFVLMALIEIFGPICTAYFNPAVTLAMLIDHRINIRQALKYSFAQILGGIAGLLFTHLMFIDVNKKFVDISNISRDGGVYLAEILGTFILVLCIFSLVNQKSDRVSFIVGFLVGGMLLSTSSTMFANPQVTIARIFTYSQAGISPFDAVVFIFMQIIGTIFAVLVWKKIVSICSTDNSI